ncbi:MAG: DUF1997 domain-containing protein [Cyanobacteria bacterium P01_E01_bin.48]
MLKAQATLFATPALHHTRFAFEGKVSYQFKARQTATVRLCGNRDRVREFLQDPQHLIAALLDREQVRQIDRHQFEVSMRPIGALGMTIQPIVRLDIRSNADDGSVQLQALGCRIAGNDWIDRRFNLIFQGELAPSRTFEDRAGEVTLLSGVADLSVSIELPPIMQLTPRSVVNGVGTTVTQGVLAALQRSLSKRLPQHFSHWSRLTTPTTLPSDATLTAS